MDGQRADKREFVQELEPVLVRVDKKNQISQDIHITKNEVRFQACIITSSYSFYRFDVIIFYNFFETQSPI